MPLLQVSKPEFKQLKACRREVQLLKTLWDVITLVRSSFDDWNTTLWSDINVENMEMECKKFVKVSSHDTSPQSSVVACDNHAAVFDCL